MYAIWTFLFVLALSERSQTDGRKGMWIAIIIGTITGMVLETGQYYMMQGRSFELWDIAANTAGAIIGAWVGLKVKKGI